MVVSFRNFFIVFYKFWIGYICFEFLIGIGKVFKVREDGSLIVENFVGNIYFILVIYILMLVVFSKN